MCHSQETFGKKVRRKKPKLASDDLAGLIAKAQEANEAYNQEEDGNIKSEFRELVGMRDPMFEKGKDEFSIGSHHIGTSKRIWAELYKVIDSSDILVQVLDARDPMGKCAG